MDKTLLDHKVEKFKNEMIQWMKAIGIPSIEPQRSIIEDILLLSYEELKELSSKELAEYSFMMAQYALFVQGKINQYNSFIDWSKRANVKDDDKVRLLNWTNSVKDKLMMISYFTRRIETISQTLSNLSRIKYGEQK